MKISNLILICILAHSVTYTMHIKDLTTVIQDGKRELSVFKLLYEYRHHNFGATPVFNTCQQKPFFLQNIIDEKKQETITTLSDSSLLKIAQGKSIYCPKVYSDNDKHAIICCQDTDEMSEIFVHQTYNNFLLYLLTNAYVTDRLEQKRTAEYNTQWNS